MAIIKVDDYIAFCAHSGVNSTAARLEFEAGDYRKLADKIFDNIFEFKDITLTQGLVDALRADKLAEFLHGIENSNQEPFKAKATDILHMSYRAGMEVCKTQARALKMYQDLMEMSQFRSRE